MKLIFIVACVVLINYKLSCQPKYGQMSFGLIRIEVYDTSKFTLDDVTPNMERIAERYECDLYFNRKYVLVLREEEQVTWKTLYDRKKQILYSTWDVPENSKFIIIDSVQGYIFPVESHISGIDNDKKSAGYINHPNRTKNIYGFDCFEVTYPSGSGKVRDSKVFVSEDIIVPSALLFNAGPFREKGIPMEYWLEMVNSTIIIGVKEFHAKKLKKKMFKWNMDQFEVINTGKR